MQILQTMQHIPGNGGNHVLLHALWEPAHSLPFLISFSYTPQNPCMSANYARKGHLVKKLRTNVT